MSARDTLGRNELVTLAEDLYKHGSTGIAKLANRLGIASAEILSLKQFCTQEDLPLLILLEWKKRQAVASRSKLANALNKSGFETLAVKLDESCKSNSE